MVWLARQCIKRRGARVPGNEQERSPRFTQAFRIQVVYRAEKVKIRLFPQSYQGVGQSVPLTPDKKDALRDAGK